MGKYEEVLYDYIIRKVEEYVDDYNQEAIDKNKTNYIDIDSLFERTFCYIIVKFLFDSHIEFSDKSPDFEIKLINDEGINSYDSIITGNIKNEFKYKDSFFTKILPVYYTQMFYKNMEFVELSIKNFIFDMYIAVENDDEEE